MGKLRGLRSSATWGSVTLSRIFSRKNSCTTSLAAGLTITSANEEFSVSRSAASHPASSRRRISSGARVNIGSGDGVIGTPAVDCRAASR